MMHKCVWWALLLLGFGLGALQAQSLEAFASKTQVGTGEPFEVSFRFRELAPQGFRPPAFGRLEIMGGPSTQQSTTIANGRMARSVTYTWTLSAPKSGSYTIPAASIEKNGQTYRSEPLTIKVSAEGGARDQIGDNYRLYTRYRMRMEPQNLDFPGFWVEEMNQGQRATWRNETYRGKEYNVANLREVLLIPLRPGTQRIDPLEIESEVQV